MERSEVIELIKKKIERKYGRKSLSDICNENGWSISELSRAINEVSNVTIPKKFLDFVGVKSIKPPIVYEFKNKSKNNSLQKE